MLKRGKKGEEDFSFVFLVVIFIVAIIAVIAYFTLNQIVGIGRGSSAAWACEKIEVAPLSCIYNGSDTYSTFSISYRDLDSINLTMVYEKGSNNFRYKNIFSKDPKNLTSVSILFNDMTNALEPPKFYSILPSVKVNNDIYLCDSSIVVNCFSADINSVENNAETLNFTSVPIESTQNNINYVDNTKKTDNLDSDNKDSDDSCIDRCASDSCLPDLKGYQICGNFDSDSCLELGIINYCTNGKSCNNATYICEKNANPPGVTDQIFYSDIPGEYSNQDGREHSVRIFSYKYIDGSYIYSTDYATDSIINPSMGGINWTWSKVDDADGYLIVNPNFECTYLDDSVYVYSFVTNEELLDTKIACSSWPVGAHTEYPPNATQEVISAF